MPNIVTIVSLGPGEPELITLKGLNCLRQADFVYCPATIMRNGTMVSRAQEILKALGITASVICPFPVSMSENRSAVMKDYDAVVRMIEEKYNAGYDIAITAEGDAGFYSSSAYISDMLIKKGIPVKRIAGIPAFIACAASENIRISEQKEETLVLTHLTSSEELVSRIEEGHTLVLMKASRFESIVKEALSLVPENVSFHYFENTGMPTKAYHTCRKEDILSRRFPYFSLLIIKQ